MPTRSAPWPISCSIRPVQCPCASKSQPTWFEVFKMFGPLMTIPQERRLLTAIREAADTDFRVDLESVASALRPATSKAESGKAQ